MTRLQKIWFYFLRGLCHVVGALPYWVLYYPILEFIYFIVYHIARYRVPLVRRNLKNTLKELDAKELKRIEKAYYHNLAEIFIDTIDFVGITRRQVEKRAIYENIDQLKEETKDKDYICALAHYGNWEYVSLYPVANDTHIVAGLYKPLKDKISDEFFKKSRKKFGSEVVPMNDILRFIIKNKRNKDGKRLSIGMIADQVPTREAHPLRLEFLGRQTIFFTGTEKLALKFKMPVYFLNIKKTSRSHYVFRFEMIYDGMEEVEENEITIRYVHKLEEQIKACPELWLWSHRRWKRTKDKWQKQA